MLATLGGTWRKEGNNETEAASRRQIMKGFTWHGKEFGSYPKCDGRAIET